MNNVRQVHDQMQSAPQLAVGQNTARNIVSMALILSGRLHMPAGLTHYIAQRCAWSCTRSPCRACQHLKQLFGYGKVEEVGDHRQRCPGTTARPQH